MQGADANAPTLVIGNKNYSSWSLRAWLLMKVAGIAFREVRIALYGPGSKLEILRHSPSGKVPCLVDGATQVWDSLAIGEYLAEARPGLWPESKAARAHARSISAEMHSGFPNLRQHMSMNCRKRHPDKGRTPEVLEEIGRIVSIWSGCRQEFGAQGEFLFGRFSIADAMYAPVVLRFRTYAVELPPVCRAYADAMLALPAMREWLQAAEQEVESIPAFEMYGSAPAMKTYIVGGAVRDELLGLPVVDRDWVVVGATPEDLVALGYRPVGRDFPVFLHPQTHEEYALARTERKSGRGYRGFTVYSAPDVTLEEDLARRDLTINAMAKDEAGALVDPFGGARDLQDRVLRHVSEAFAEDPVRILRVARFAARFRFPIAAETLALMRSMVDVGEADHLVAERVWQEFSRGLEEPFPGEMLLVLERCGALAKLLPELLPVFEGGLRAGMLAALERAAQAGASLPVRFALLAWPLGADAVRGIDALCERLRAPAEVRELALLALRWQAELRAAADAPPEALLALLKKADALRRGERFGELLAVLGLAEPGAESKRAAMQLERARVAAMSIDAGAVARAAGESAQIPGRIDAARLAAVRAALG